MKTFLGLFLILLGIVVGLYTGAYLLLYGGIVQLIRGLQHPFVATDIAGGVVRIIFASPAGWVSCLVFVGTGQALLEN